ncbi:Hsp70 family protein [Paraflavitalea pollutisoli]|uniref:Hsp70 family protein n=1 Tax=Paraflavitalea pollutisoli TaxID=3034143 RepID=UPI0023EBC57E|nr:Hsp70 family protein [Paraflavitalea sp. H1-2-19X]
MSSTINFAIDLGTTNSLIAKAHNGRVDVFKNPSGMKTTLPSVVAFRKDRILIGDKAREYVEKDPTNVFASFKRKMGTGERFFVPNNVSFKTPIELSTLILQELKHFIFTGESPSSVVITIPASFDTVQSNATKEAGYAAGFQEVLLLQEPIAASLAFANKTGKDGLEGQWLVYDLGGGTFDVALVVIEDDEMKVIDHEGDNFFGGIDFDNEILTRLFIPYLEARFGIQDLSSKMLSSNGKYNKLYYQLLYKAEEAKIALSSYASTDIEFDFTDEADETHEVYFSVSREKFEGIILERLQSSIAFIRDLLSRNNLQASDITEVVLVGGSTYIPLVRSLLTQELGVTINTSIDPTTAVAEGAAWYAGSKPCRVVSLSAAQEPSAATSPTSGTPAIVVKTAYQANSRDAEEYLAATIQHAPTGSTYRITRSDGGFDSGLKPVQPKISEMLLLVPNSMNIFNLKLFDQQGFPLPASIPEITIVQGKFSIYGQPLPNDICLEVDDTDNKTTHLELIFERNAILPIKKTITKTLSRTIIKGSDDQLLINVLEGSRYASPPSNLPIGIVGISGRDLPADLVKGSDLDLTFEISESRDITVTAYISQIDKEISEVFNPSSRTVNITRLQQETDYLHRLAKRQLDNLLKNEKYEESATLQQTLEELETILRKLRQLTADDVTDTKYQLDDQKRRLAQAIATVEKGDKLLELKEEYYEKRDMYRLLLLQTDNKELQQRLEGLHAAESAWINNCSTQFLKLKINELDRLTWEVRKKDIGYVTSLYMYYTTKPNEEYSNQAEIRSLKKRGDEALTRQNTHELLSIIYRMYELLIDKDQDEAIKGTGLRG